MSLLYRVLFAAACKNTHHRLALDALRLLRHPQAETWRNLFLEHHAAYLKGSKAPDEQFKDFQNHVLHVRDNYWGGALKTAQLWYKLTLGALRNEDWRDVVYSAGVLSHYVTDPLMPFHSGQTEAEGKIHRAAEWSIAQSYVELQNIAVQDLGGYPVVETHESPGWLCDLIRSGAETGNAYYETLLEHYNLALGVKDPPRGLDQELKDCLARQIALTAASWAAVLDRLFVEAAVTPPPSNPTLKTFVATLSIPAYWVTKRLQDATDRAQVQAIFDEVQATGKATLALPEDEKTVRRLHAEQVLQVSPRTLDAQKPPPTGTKHGTGAAPRLRSNRARIFGAPTTATATPTPAAKRMIPAVTLPKLSLPKVKIPKVALPKLAVPALPRLSLPKVSFRKKPAVETSDDTKPPLKTAIESPPRPMKRTDVDAPRQAPSSAEMNAESNSSSLLRRTDPPAAGPAHPRTRREADDLRFYLSVDDPIEQAPSIGPKTARRLEAVGIHTVADLLECDPAAMSRKLNSSWLTPDVLVRWQRQAVLMCRVPNLRGHDAQLIVGAGIEDAETLAGQSPDELLDDVEKFTATSDGEKVLRGGAPPDLDEVTDWIRWASQPRPPARV